MATCRICGKEMPRNRRLYCSEKCARAGAAYRWYPRRGEQNYRTGRAAKDIYLAYNYHCAVCGWGLTDDLSQLVHLDGREQKANGCEIHHIVPIKDGGGASWNNLILLCPNCHKCATAGIYDAEFLRKYQLPLEELEPMRESRRADNRSGLVATAKEYSKQKQSKPLDIAKMFEEE